MLDLILIALTSYLLGSFPTGIIAARLFKGIDIRDFGSGNTGATNSFRVLGWKEGLVVALIDIAKGWAAVFFLTRISIFGSSSTPPGSVLFITATLAAVLGHIKPVFAGFKGGKGFGTAAGAISAAYPVLAPVCLGIFLLSLTLTGYVAVSASITALSLPFLYLIMRFLFDTPIDLVILVFFFCAPGLTLLGVRKKLILYFTGKAELFEKIMLIKPKRTGTKA